MTKNSPEKFDTFWEQIKLLSPLLNELKLGLFLVDEQLMDETKRYLEQHPLLKKVYRETSNTVNFDEVSTDTKEINPSLLES